MIRSRCNRAKPMMGTRRTALCIPIKSRWTSSSSRFLSRQAQSMSNAKKPLGISISFDFTNLSLSNARRSLIRSRRPTRRTPVLTAASALTPCLIPAPARSARYLARPVSIRIPTQLIVQLVLRLSLAQPARRSLHRDIRRPLLRRAPRVEPVRHLQVLA